MKKNKSNFEELISKACNVYTEKERKTKSIKEKIKVNNKQKNK